ncbi:MAG: antibiotic biosynthesis monooxygenase [Chloroflexi bacterium]|nr:antibiotic biosynthesis monooxygenase [Chloroflexota bacterium]
MYFVRVSRIAARRGQEERVRHLLGDLAQFISLQEGCWTQFVLASSNAPRTFLRISIWQDKTHADRAAMQSKAMALRSELMAWAESHPEEDAYDLTWVSGSLPKMIAPKAA